MNLRVLHPDEPLRLALALMLLALLLPLCVVVWLLLKTVHSEQLVVRQELIGAYRSQFIHLVEEKGEDWRHYVEAIPWDGSHGTMVDWMHAGGLEAMLFIGADGALHFPAVQSLPDSAPADEVLNALLQEVEVSLRAESTVPGELAAAVVKYLETLRAPSREYFANAGNRWALLRLSEITETNDPWAKSLVGFWGRIFTPEAEPLRALSWRDRGFTAHFLRERPDLFGRDEALSAALLSETRRFRLQEQLLRFYYQQNWRAGESMERWLVFLRPDEELAGEPVFTHIKTDSAGVVILQVRESAFTERLAAVWEGPAATANLWIQLRTPSGTTYQNFDTGEVTTAPFASIDLEAPFYGWKVDLGFRDDTFLARSSRRETTVSIIIGVTLVLLIALIGFLALRQVNRQIRLNRMKNDFIGLVSHELRTPLASMRMLVDTLIEGRYRDESTLHEYLGLVSSENQRLSRLVESFLTFSRMQRGKSQFHTEPVDTYGVVHSALTATRQHMEEPCVSFTTKIDPGLPPILGDSDALVTVLINLLENAYKYTGEDKKICLAAFVVNGSVIFEVADNGIGISARELKHIFKEFYQVDNRLARRSEGSGLGLAINQHIVRAHKGRIEVESTPGKGSTFRVRLPAHTPLKNARPKASAATL